MAGAMIGGLLSSHAVEARAMIASDPHLSLSAPETERPRNFEVLVDGRDVTDAIRTAEVSQAASRVAADPGVRAALVVGRVAHGVVVGAGAV